VIGERRSSGAPDTDRPSGGSQFARTRRWRELLTALTVVWLLALAVATVRQTDRFYPVTSYSMFSYPTGGLNVQFDLVGTTGSSTTEALPAGDFGLTDLQMRSFVAHHVGDRPDRLRPDAERAVDDLARVWNARHGAELDALTVVRVEYGVGQAAPRRTPLQEWSR
jgi:hypothetical protein